MISLPCSSYANSIIQCLSSTEPLLSYLFSKDYGENCMSLLPTISSLKINKYII